MEDLLRDLIDENIDSNLNKTEHSDPNDNYKILVESISRLQNKHFKR